MADEIIEFLIRAKRATYAGKGAETDSSRPASHDLQYQEDTRYYYDTYLGGRQFAGEEAVWEDGKPMWAMNYCGRVLSEEFDGDFLKEALFRVPKEIPYRGPLFYEREGYRYNCEVAGNFEWFSGDEVIYKNDLKVYECLFHGGMII